MTKEELKKLLEEEHSRVIKKLAQQLEIVGQPEMAINTQIEAIIDKHEIEAVQEALQAVKATLKTKENQDEAANQEVKLPPQKISRWRQIKTWAKENPEKSIPIILALISLFFTIIELILSFIGGVNDGWDIKNKIVEEEKKQQEQITKKFTPIFNDASKDSLFKILILPFENRIKEKKTEKTVECVGEAIYRHLEDQLRTHDSIPIWVEYADTILPPRKADSAIVIRQRHKADLIIYGLATPTCSQSEVCFRYALTDSLVNTTKDSPIKAHNHSIATKTLSTREIEQGEVSLDLQYMVYWVGALAVLNSKPKKIENANKAISYLNKIIEDLEIVNQDVIKKKAFCFLYRGSIYNKKKQYKKALKDYNKAIYIDSKNAMIYNNRAQLYHDLKQYKKALKDYNKAIYIDNKIAMIYNNRAVIYYELKQYKKALKDYNKAIYIDSKDAIVYNNRGVIYYELKQYKKALKDYNKAIYIDNNFFATYQSRGQLYKDLKQYKKALKDYNKAIEIIDEKENPLIIQIIKKNRELTLSEQKRESWFAQKQKGIFAILVLIVVLLFGRHFAFRQKKLRNQNNMLQA